MHDIKRLVMRHFEGFEESFGEGITTGEELVLVAGDLLWDMDGFDVSAVGTIDGDGLRVVDVVDDDVALCSCDDANVVAHALCRRLDIGDDTILEDDGDGVGEVHAGGALHAVAVNGEDFWGYWGYWGLWDYWGDWDDWGYWGLWDFWGDWGGQSFHSRIFC